MTTKMSRGQDNKRSQKTLVPLLIIILRYGSAYLQHKGTLIGVSIILQVKVSALIIF
jgi:hypothetical protein